MLDFLLMAALVSTNASVQDTDRATGRETGGLQANPQQGATPVPLERVEVPASTGEPQQVQVVPTLPIRPAEVVPMPAPPFSLPVPERNPLATDPASDPVLMLVRQSDDPARFRATLASAIATNPVTDEALAQTAEAEANEDLAISSRYPVADFTLSYFGTIARNFSDDPGNLLESSRPRSRADALLRIQQPLIDFGASASRVAAERDRVAAAIYGESVAANIVALNAVNAWNGVFGFRALVRLGSAFQSTQEDLRVLVEERIASGVSARGDYAQVESYLAAADARLADYGRAAASAEATFRELTGTPPPQAIGPVPLIAPVPDLSAAERFALTVPAVLAARKRADAARLDVAATKADQLPRLTAGIDAGDYGVLDSGRDYDVRANVALTYRLGGSGPARVDAVEARELSAEASYRRIRNQALRDARIAWGDVEALETAAAAIEANYIASRTARDVLLERFRVARGSLFDVLAAEDNFFQVAARYVQVMTELGVARYVLLARTGQLLPAIHMSGADAGVMLSGQTGSGQDGDAFASELPKVQPNER
ncbi:TolC family protein [Pseudopontixanthobacter vadosimaris]|uniref:TolC family protein n=1 Tax=Pseudopontixanthobacter vadosimaris TaxID=2726450 RepID=UPI0014751E28|nr:TolC family protein [Pseudopontixanthobacter vadosimaris]